MVSLLPRLLTSGLTSQSTCKQAGKEPEKGCRQQEAPKPTCSGEIRHFGIIHSKSYTISISVTGQSHLFPRKTCIFMIRLAQVKAGLILSEPGVAEHAFNLNTWEAETGQSVSLRPAWTRTGQLGLYRETVLKKQKK